VRAEESARRNESIAIIWWLRQTRWREILHLAWSVKKLSQPEFVKRLQRVGFTPKGTKT
jgi:hypothetical protein